MLLLLLVQQGNHDTMCSTWGETNVVGFPWNLQPGSSFQLPSAISSNPSAYSMVSSSPYFAEEGALDLLFSACRQHQEDARGKSGSYCHVQLCQALFSKLSFPQPLEAAVEFEAYGGGEAFLL